MFNMKRNQIIITALVVMIAVAGYLSYTDNNKTNITSLPLTDSGELSPLVLDPQESLEANKYLTNSEVAEEDIGIALTPEDSADSSDNVSKVEDVKEEDSAMSEEIDDGTDSIYVNAPVESADGFFTQAKLVREQDRSKQREVLTDMINNKNLSGEQKAKYADEMLNIQKRIEKESAAEAMIEAKGFKEVYVRIDDETVDVVVGKEVLTDAEIAQIEDIVKRKTGMDTTQIRISPMKK